jgi:hypothetical protein
MELEMALGGRFWEKIAKTLRKFARKKLAERVGVFDRDCEKANECNGFPLISRNRSDLASSNACQR